MVDFIKAYPSPVNRPLLLEELASAGFTTYSTREDDMTIHNVLSEDEAAIDGVIATHDASQLTDEQKVEQAAQIAVQNGKGYLRKQLLNPSPDVTAIYNTLKSQVDGNAYLSQIVQNQVTLNENSFGWTLDLSTPTALDRQRYILTVEMVIALLT